MLPPEPWLPPVALPPERPPDPVAPVPALEPQAKVPAIKSQHDVVNQDELGLSKFFDRVAGACVNAGCVELEIPIKTRSRIFVPMSR
jgi:hypothetical protein